MQKCEQDEKEGRQLIIHISSIILRCFGQIQQ